MTFSGDPSLINLNFDAPCADPLLILREWLEMADKIGIIEPRSMVLSTIDIDNRPSSRVVILKDCNEQGVIFSTSQGSAKGKDLLMNPWACGTLYWRETIQQINFKGKTTPLSNNVSDKIFQEWSRDAKAVAVISKKSEPLINEKELEDSVLNLINSREEIERPKEWKAYLLIIESIEFWHGRENRLHKRLRYDLIDKVWHHQRLQP